MTHSTRRDAALLPFGDSELATLTREHSWSSTPLGPIESWPQSLRTVVDVVLTSRFSMWMGWGPELRFFYNDAYRRDTLGVKHPWALGRPFREVWSEIWDALQPRIREVLDTGHATWDEGLLLFLERSGYQEETYHTFSYSPLRDDQGQVAGVFCVVAEVTERVIGERRLSLLRELAAALASTTGEADVLDTAQRVLAEGDKDLCFTATYLFEPGADTNSQVARLACVTGFPTGHAATPQVIDVRAADAAWPALSLLASQTVVVDDLATRFDALPAGAWERPPHRAVLVPVEQRGQELPAGFMIIGINPYRQFDASYEGFVHLVAGQVASNLANARAYEQERQRAESLAELDRAKTMFFSNVSHEFRTPLTLLLGPLEEVLRGDSLSGGAREELSMAHRNALRLVKLVNSLLDFSRVEAGRANARYEATDFASCTADLASGFRSATERAGLALTLDTQPLDQPVYVDRDMWEKVVLNLLSNAFKHTFVGGITVRVRQSGHSAVLEVEDTGVGIAASELPRVFDRFHRVPNAQSRTHEGTGIGLALVQEIVRRHNGDIAVSSQEGVGTRFTVRVPLGSAHLPREQIADAADAANAQQSTATGAAAYVEEAMRWTTGVAPETPPIASTGERILLADDNADMREYVTRLLHAEGWDVDAVADGNAALERIRTNRPNLVLTDVMMPGLDGFELLRAIRADPSRATIPVILLSARAGEEARVEGAKAGADGYLAKPFAAQELVARVGAHLSLARERARASAAMTGARDLLMNVLEQAPVGICVLRGPDSIFELANSHYLKFFPPGHAVLGRPVRDVIPEADAQGFVALIDGVRNTGQPWSGRATEIKYDRFGTGTPVPAYLNILYHPYYEADGTIVGVIAVVADVTDEVLAGRAAEAARLEAEDARAAAESANRAKSEFLAVMSHELRTPLNAIGGYAELLEMGIHGPITNAQRDALNRLTRSQRHLLGLINDVLNLARIETGRVDYTLEAVAVSELMSGIAPMIEPQLNTKGLRYSVTLPNDTLAVTADREKLGQIMLNLLSNAVKFTAPGGEVAVTVAAAGDHVTIAVTDTGIGVPPDKIEAIFEPFVQAHGGPSRAAEGAGLGLAISRDLARGMGGDVTLHSARGKGSTFTVSMPAAER
jgi:signal transduction histidine kinase/CheY-like chemotaxis protein